MKEPNANPSEIAAATLNVGFVPTPTREYRERRKTKKLVLGAGLPIPRPVHIPQMLGSRVLMYKQDPSVGEIGIRKAFIPGWILAGPRDSRVTSAGLPVATPNALGDFIETPGVDAFDAVHTFAVVRQALTMCQRTIGTAISWQWNTLSSTDPIEIYAHAGATMNAYYSRHEKALKFFYFNKPNTPPGSQVVYTCRSLDIVAHETGHAILDGLQPGWLALNNSPQAGGLHESFGDLTAIFLTLSQMDQVEAIIAQTKSNLHDKTFLSDIAEEFGLVLGRPNGLRNADNDLKLSQVGNEVHAISQVFTGAIYDILADIFAFERQPSKRDDAAVLYEVGQYVWSLVIRAVKAAPTTRPTFADIANQMLTIAADDKKPVQYRNFIRNRFAIREVIIGPTSFAEDHKTGVRLEAFIKDDPEARQDRRGCCGTMLLAEFNDAEKAMDAEIQELKRMMKASPV